LTVCKNISFHERCYCILSGAILLVLPYIFPIFFFSSGTMLKVFTEPNPAVAAAPNLNRFTPIVVAGVAAAKLNSVARVVAAGVPAAPNPNPVAPVVAAEVATALERDLALFIMLRDPML
jgi:hypothetical protein